MTNVAALLVFLTFLKPVLAGAVSRLLRLSLRLSVFAALSAGIFWAQTKAAAKPPSVAPPSATQAPAKPPSATQAAAQPKPSDAPAEPAADQQSALRTAMEESIAKQKASVGKQVGGAAPSDSFFTFGWSGPPLIPPATAPIACNAIEAEAEPLIASAASAHKVDPALVRAVIRQESGFYPCAVSPKGAMGMMQLMPETAAQYNVADPFDPEHNIEGGVRYLKDLLARYKGEVKLALAAYNAGPKRVDGPSPHVPEIAETKDYVSRIMGELDRTQAQQAAAEQQTSDL